MHVRLAWAHKVRRTGHKFSCTIIKLIGEINWKLSHERRIHRCFNYYKFKYFITAIRFSKSLLVRFTQFAPTFKHVLWLLSELKWKPGRIANLLWIIYIVVLDQFDFATENPEPYKCCMVNYSTVKYYIYVTQQIIFPRILNLIIALSTSLREVTRKLY